MTTYLLSENYGAYGPAHEISFRTTTLLSCSAIIMYRSATTMLGLYHYGSLSLTGATVQAVIRQMVNDIRPDQIVLWEAKAIALDSELFRITIELDNAKVRQFLLLTKASTCGFVQQKNEVFPGVWVDKGALSFSYPGSFGEDPPANPGFQRLLRGNLAFFHADSSGSGVYARKVHEAAQTIEGIRMEERYG